jgi:dihydroneopterin aldolase
MREPSTRPTVVKIGGSLLGTPLLENCLAAVASAPAPVAVVPGGGIFANNVREAQRMHPIADPEAHCMALLAMAQFAHVVAACEPRMSVAISVEAAQTIMAVDRIPVWAPLDLVQVRDRVPENWNMTSDSLAAWFAGRVGAKRLVLVKSAPHDPSLAPASRCVSAGLVDPLFPGQLAEAGIDAFWIGDGDATRLAAFLAGEPARAVAIAA